MAIVNALRFNEHSGAMLADEDFWDIRFRRKTWCDNLHSLLDADIADELKIEVAYGGTGYPSLHSEIVTGTSELLREKYKTHAQAKKKSPPFQTVKEIALISLEVMQKVIRRRLDERLKFFFNFTTDDLTRGYFIANGEKYETKQENVKKRALDIAGGKEGDRLMKAIFKSRAVIFGYDPANGITAYYLDPQNSILAVNYEGFEAIGTGRYASGLSLGKFLNNKPSPARKKGYSRQEGLLELITSGITASDHYHEVGGTLNLLYIDGTQKTHSQRYVEIFDDRARLASEITKMYLCKQISRNDALDLIDKLIFGQARFETIEDALLSKVANVQAAKFALRGYKLDEVSEMAGPRPKKARK